MKYRRRKVAEYTNSFVNQASQRYVKCGIEGRNGRLSSKYNAQEEPEPIVLPVSVQCSMIPVFNQPLQASLPLFQIN
jgi:hypothetical protein